MVTSATPDPSPAAAPVDVFISYARANRQVAQQLADALEGHGLNVWWDRDLSAGSEFAEVIEDRLREAGVVLVLWSADSVRSGFVRDESSRALRAGKLLPVRIEDVELPLGFGQLHTIDLLGWDGDEQSADFTQLLFEVRARKGNPALPPARLRRPIAQWGMKRWLAAGIAALLLAVGGYVGKQAWDRRQVEQQRLLAQAEAARQAERAQAEADRHFRAGLDAQYASVPQLERALNEYLSALENRPAHGRARYYLGHVYAQTDQPGDALEAFKLALTRTEAPLDRSQRADADRQILALARVDEAPALMRGADSAAVGAAGVGAAVPAPAPLPDPPARPTIVPVPGDRPGAGQGTGSGRGSGGGRGTSPPAAVTAAPPPTLAPTVATRQPQRIEPPAATLAPVDALVAGMFDANKEKRITATTSLVVDPDALSDALPLAISRALSLLRATPSAQLTPAASSGVVNTLVLLQSALPGSLEMQRDGIQALLAAAQPLGDYTRQQAAKVQAQLDQAGRVRPIAYIQIANEAQRPIANALAARFKTFGYDAPGIELVGDRAPQRNELRVQGKSDRYYARWITKTVGELAGGVPKVSTLRNARPKADTFEVWLAKDLCAPGGPVAAGCAGG